VCYVLALGRCTIDRQWEWEVYEVGGGLFGYADVSRVVFEMEED